MKRFFLVLAIALVWAAPVAADQITPKAAIERLFTSAKVDASWFAPSFLAQASVAQIQTIVDQFKSQLGAYAGVTSDGDHFSTNFDKGSVATYIKLDDNGQISGLLFKLAVLKPTQTGATPTTGANAITPKAALARLFTSDTLNPDWFASVVTTQISMQQLQTIVNQFKAQLGIYADVRQDGDHFAADFQKGYVPSYITLDGGGRITGLLFKAAIPKSKDLGAALNEFKQLPGKISIVVEEGSRNRAEFHADDVLAVGSAFKLAVLEAAKKQVDAKRHSWNEIVILRERWKSLPSGILQTWPDGSHLTLHTVASLMISQSDNTAADLVLRTVGRIAVEAESPRNHPFLTTREAFQLKDPKNADLLAKWRTGDALVRREVTGSLQSRPLPSYAIFGGEPLDLDIEWFFTTRELCALMSEVAPLPFTSINPGVADPAAWRHISYKGGSEPGVLNLTTRLQSKAGKTYCVSATWNDTRALDEKRFELLYAGLINNL